MFNKTNKLNYSLALSTNEPIGTNVDNGKNKNARYLTLAVPHLFKTKNLPLI